MVIDAIVRPQALQKIKDYQQKEILVVIVSASIENWIIPWAKKNQIAGLKKIKLMLLQPDWS